MVYAAYFAATAIACYLVAHLLGRATWPWRSPRVAILCWQALGLALGLSAIGVPMSVGLAPYDESTGSALRDLAADLAYGELPPDLGVMHLGLVGVGFGVAAVLLGSTVRSLHGALRVQRRHRDLLTLVARNDPAAPGVLVLDHPSAAAYCLPGVRPRVVVSAGTLRLLDRAQLAAVLSHERAHADERHDLVLLPFTALRQALPGIGWVRTACDTVALLVEMRADDKARQLHADGPLAAALLRFATAGSRVTPAGALGIDGQTRPRTGTPARTAVESPRAEPPARADRELDARLHRLRVAGRPPRLRRALVLVAAAALVSLPISLFVS